MNTTGRYFWTLLRRFKEAETLSFPLLIEVEEDGELFGATIRGLESNVIATGDSPLEAHEIAMRMFKNRVDYVLENKQGASPAEQLGPAIQFGILPLSFDLASELLEKLYSRTEELPEWTLAPQGPYDPNTMAA